MRGSRRLHTGIRRAVGVVFDIDGVLQRGHTPIAGAAQALQLLREHQIPHCFVTNNGGRTEARKAEHLNAVLGGAVTTPEQMCLAHTPMRDLASKYATKPVLLLGSIDTWAVAREYGFQNAYTVADLCNARPEMWPFFDAQQCHLRMQATADASMPPAPKTAWPDEPFAAVVQLTDAVDWAVELQLTLDVVRGGTPIGSGMGQAVPVYASNADFTFQGEYGAPRLAGGAFLECLAALFHRCTNTQLEVEYFGKPFLSTYTFAEKMLEAHAAKLGCEPPTEIWAIGDNPLSDIRGSNNAGEKWRSVLVKTGVWDGWRRGEDNCQVDPAVLVVDDVLKAVKHILHE